MSAVEIFELFFTDDVIKLLQTESDKYAAFKNLPAPDVSAEEMRSFHRHTDIDWI